MFILFFDIGYCYRLIVKVLYTKKKPKKDECNCMEMGCEKKTLIEL